VALQEGTARRYLEYQSLKSSLELFAPRAVVPWTSYLFPPELPAAYGLTPLIPEVAASSLMGSEYRPQVEAAMNRSALSRDVCSYHRASLAALEAGLLPQPSLCLAATPLCLGKDRLMDELADRLGIPHLEAFVPLPPDEGEAPSALEAATAAELRRVYDDLGRLLQRRGHLERAVRLSNRAAAAWAEVTRRRIDGSLTLNGRQAFAFNFLGQLLRGTEAGARGFEKLLDEEGRRDLLAPPGLRFRLLWLHTVPHFDHSLVDLIQARGGVISFEEMAQMQLDQVDPADPFPGLARRLIEHPLWGSARRRARLVTSLARRTRAQGVIHFNQWGCRHGLGTLPVLREVLAAEGIPFLALDGDALADRGSADDRTLAQLETFLDLLQ
jgi:benzoyl-CoA reductase/2-hydroxyglutaryl-CoA dehydratase subunit BcrC/BadD/HgdB